MHRASTHARASCSRSRSPRASSSSSSSSSSRVARARRLEARAPSRVDARALALAASRVRPRARTRADARRVGVDPFEDAFAELERETRSMFETMERESATARRDAAARARTLRRDASSRLDRRGDEYSREESGERVLPDGGVHRYYVSERVTTYGTPRARPPPPAFAASGFANAAATLVAVAATAAYATMTRRFLRGYDRTSYKEDVKMSVATRWPVLWAASPKFREEFRRATTEDARREERDDENAGDESDA